MNLREIHCICPPSPELEKRIARSKQRILARESLPTERTAELLDIRSFTLIAREPIEADKARHLYFASPGSCSYHRHKKGARNPG